MPEVELVVAKDSLEQVRDVDAAFGFIDAAHIRAGKKLRWVQQGSAGVEGVVTIPELVERDIVLTNMQRIFAPEIADQAIAYLLAFTRGLTHFIRKPPEGAWRYPPEIVFEELQGKTLLVIALGGIGSEIARRAFGFGMRILATDPKVIEKPLFVEELHRPEAFHRLLPRADVVASAVPLTPVSRRMIGEREFGMMKRGTILINVSRGGVVDTEALIAALDRGPGRRGRPGRDRPGTAPGRASTLEAKRRSSPHTRPVSLPAASGVRTSSSARTFGGSPRARCC